MPGRLRKGKAKGAQPEAGQPVSPADKLRSAILGLKSNHQKKQRKRSGKRRHVDDYRELVLDGSRTAGLSEALSALVAETHQNRARLLPEAKPTVALSGTPAATREDAARRAETASRALKQEMQKCGVKERTHYYSATERRETGEIDRTYLLKRSRSQGRPERS